MSGQTRLNKPICCPNCGHSLEQPNVTDWNFSEWKLTTQFGQIILKSKLQARIFDLLWRKQAIRGLTRQRILDIIYMDDIDGGPEIHAIGAAVRRLRLDLIEMGIFLSRGFTGGEGYSLLFYDTSASEVEMPITPEQLAKSGSEDGEQLALLCWCSENFEKYPELKRLVHIPNGGYRDKREAAKFKAMGVKNGFPDLMLPVKRGHWQILFIEMKKIKGGVVSDEQREWHKYLRMEGHGVIVCYGWLEARKVLIDYLEFK